MESSFLKLSNALFVLIISASKRYTSDPSAQIVVVNSDKPKVLIISELPAPSGQSLQNLPISSFDYDDVGSRAESENKSLCFKKSPFLVSSNFHYLWLVLAGKSTVFSRLAALQLYKKLLDFRSLFSSFRCCTTCQIEISPKMIRNIQPDEKSCKAFSIILFG